MIIRQTTTIVFEYPQDYLQEQEWCKTKDDRWVHKSTDTLGAVYENTISYSIGQPSNSGKPNNCEDEPTTQTETQNSNLTFEKRTMCDCYNCKRYETEGECIECHYKPKDEPQPNADQHIQDVESVESVEQTEAWREPFETDCSWK